MDFFPEDGYDPDSGEYNSEFDFDPVFTRRVSLSDNISAEISTTQPDFTPLAENLADRLNELVQRGFFDVEGNKNPNVYPPLEGSGFNTQSDTARGPFIDMEAVDEFFNRSGLRNQVQVYYDEANDVYWIDVDTNGKPAT